jgi:phage terminase large subunit-like protein
MSTQLSLFEEPATLSPVGSRDSLPLSAIEYRDSHTPPTFVSSFEGSRKYRDEFLSGARLLGLNSARKPIVPQQLIIADAINASTDDGIPLFSTMGICVPRRATKTTSIFATLLGRCLNREDYQVAYSAQNGLKSRDRYLKDIVRPLERLYPDPKTRPFKISLAKGAERIEFPNGSAFIVLPPQGESYRGDAFDCVFLDEAQELDLEDSQELIGAITPVFLTRPAAQIIIAGTAGEGRVGILWETLEKGRAEAPKYGIVEWSADENTPDPEVGSDVAGTLADPAIWRAANPAIGTLATDEAVADAFSKMTLATFSREFLGIWPMDGSAGFLNAEKWAAAALEGSFPTPPKQFGLAFAIHPMGTAASIAVAWREDGEARVGIIASQSRVDWLYKEVLRISRLYKRPIIHDTIGVSKVEAERLGRARPIPKLAPQQWGDITTAAALFKKELDNGNLKHWNQDALNQAVAVSKKRGMAGSDRWAFNALTPDADISALNAAAMALRWYDANPARRPSQLPADVAKYLKPAEAA